MIRYVAAFLFGLAGFVLLGIRGADPILRENTGLGTGKAEGAALYWYVVGSAFAAAVGCLRRGPAPLHPPAGPRPAGRRLAAGGLFLLGMVGVVAAGNGVDWFRHSRPPLLGGEVLILACLGGVYLVAVVWLGRVVLGPAAGPPAPVAGPGPAPPPGRTGAGGMFALGLVVAAAFAAGWAWLDRPPGPDPLPVSPVVLGLVGMAVLVPVGVIWAVRGGSAGLVLTPRDKRLLAGAVPPGLMVAGWAGALQRVAADAPRGEVMLLAVSGVVAAAILMRPLSRWAYPDWWAHRDRLMYPDRAPAPAPAPAPASFRAPSPPGTRYLVFAVLWLMAGLVLLLCRGVTRGYPKRYHALGSPEVEPAMYWAAVAAAVAAAGFHLTRWYLARPGRPAGGRRVWAGVGCMAAFLFIPAAIGAVGIGLEERARHGHRPQTGADAVPILGLAGLYLTLLWTLARAACGRATGWPGAAGRPPAFVTEAERRSMAAAVLVVGFGVVWAALYLADADGRRGQTTGPEEALGLLVGGAAYLAAVARHARPAWTGWRWALAGPTTPPPAAERADPPAPPAAPAPVPPPAPEPPRACPGCRAPVAADAPEGLCPRCLLRAAAPPPDRPSRTSPYHGPYVPPPVEEVQEFFPQLEVLGLIGHGGMGAVYKARQRGLDRVVALKLIWPRDDDPLFAERFNREARAMARLSHPHIVTVHETGEAGGPHYLVMEHVPGVTLRDAMRDKLLGPADALAVIRQVCDALEYAHRQGVVHRDVKPENVLLQQADGGGWRVKIADFGLAKLAAAGGPSLTGTFQAMGTPHYMAPEQWEKPAEVDHRADIFAVGVVFYELLTGELPLGRFDPPSRKAKVDARIDEVVLRALEKEPGRRYQHATDVRTALDRIGADRPAARPARPAAGAGAGAGAEPFFEYKSRATFWGLPLVHVVTGVDPAVGRQRVAVGWVAVGQYAVGPVAVGGFAVGGVAVGGFALGGVLALGGMAAGLLAAAGGMAVAGGVAAGGAAVAGFFAVGGGAAAGGYAVGEDAAARYVISNKRNDAQAFEALGDRIAGWFDWVP